AIDLFAIQKDLAARARNARIEFQFLVLNREMKGMALNLHFAATHCMASDNARLFYDVSAARKAEIFF
ncbi:MAG: hypothetical protein WBW71_16660, partial [Bacteroidota bacterium]